MRLAGDHAWPARQPVPAEIPKAQRDQATVVLTGHEPSIRAAHPAAVCIVREAVDG
jgi:hypothetical protein